MSVGMGRKEGQNCCSVLQSWPALEESVGPEPKLLEKKTLPPLSDSALIQRQFTEMKAQRLLKNFWD